jgi:hypothetical protein
LHCPFPEAFEHEVTPMSRAHSKHADFSRYFAEKQRAYLINISEERDRGQYESLSGIIVSSSENSIALQIPYAIGQIPDIGSRKTTYKLTSEAMGHGIQIMADLFKVTDNNIFHLKLHGGLEMYQRRQTPRIDTTVKIFQIRRETSLAVYRKEFKRIMDGMNTKGVRPSISLMEHQINLSAGGMRIAVEGLEPVFPLSMLFLDLNASQPLVCTVAELAWNRREYDSHVCGYRFMQINKIDQERISRYVQSQHKKQGLIAPASRINWELIDRMNNDELDMTT